MIELKINGNVYLCGDLHKDINGFLQKLKKNNIRDSHIIILGDCEVGFYKEKPAKFYNYFSKHLRLRNNTIYLVRGNHDNPEHWRNSDIENGKRSLEEKWPNIIHLRDNTLVSINNKLYFVWGGAVSIDRAILKESTSWFREERTILNTGKLLLLNDTEIFGVLAHTGPRPDNLDDKQFKRRCSFDKRLIDDIMEEQANVCQIINMLNPAVWFNGHYHTSFEKTITCGTEVKCLDILEIRKLIT